MLTCKFEVAVVSLMSGVPPVDPGTAAVARGSWVALVSDSATRPGSTSKPMQRPSDPRLGAARLGNGTDVADNPGACSSH